MTPKQCAVVDMEQDVKVRPILILMEDEILEYLSDNEESIIPIEL
jgi:hypothetical protein